MRKLYNTIIDFIINWSVRKPWIMLGIVILFTVPAGYLLKDIKVDTNLIKLLPKHAKAAVATRELEEMVGDGGHFIVLFEGKDHDKLVQAVEYTAAEMKKIDALQYVHYKWPREFLQKYRYSLLPTEYLDKMYEQLIQWEAEVNPFVDNMLEDEDEVMTHGDKEDEQDLQILIQQYQNMTEYHESADGTIFGILAPTAKGVTNIGAIKNIKEQIEKITNKAAEKYGVWSGITGNHQNKLNEYDIIMYDLNQSSIIAGILIVLILLISYKALSPIFVTIFPLIIGLVWAFALVPHFVGPLNLITAFLLLILFGMGIDYAIHIVKRFQLESNGKSLEQALKETYHSTGVAVGLSGLTTGLSLSILALSDFRGFSEFGIISAIAIFMVLCAMYLALPVFVVLFSGFKGMHKKPFVRKRVFLPNKAATVLMSLVVLSSVIYAAYNLNFDYNLANMNFDNQNIINVEELKEKQGKVYSNSMGVAAILLAPSVEEVDELKAQLYKAKDSDSTSLIGRIRSIRDYAPSEIDFEEKLFLIEDIKEQVSGQWTERIEDKAQKDMIADFLAWETPTAPPSIDEIPDIIKANYVSRNGTGHFLVTVNPSEERKDGRNAMKFTDDLYSVDMDKEIKGPIGETVVFAEVLKLVTSEGWWIAIATFSGVIILVFFNNRSIKSTLVVLVPLVGGMMLTFGVFALSGFKLTFFNMVVIPALLGMGVDGGIHYVQRWFEVKRDTDATQKELFEPLSLAIITTMLGYSGMMFANHSGISSIGNFAVMGLGLIWFATLVFLPGVLHMFERRKK